MSYVRLTEPYTRFCNLFKNFQSSGYSQNSFKSYHSLHQWRPVDDALFLDGSPQFHSHSPLQFLAARATGPSQKSTSWTRPCIWFRPTKPTPTLQEWPQKQKQPSMMSATICACIKDLLSLSTATTSFSL